MSSTSRLTGQRYANWRRSCARRAGRGSSAAVSGYITNDIFPDGSHERVEAVGRASWRHSGGRQILSILHRETTMSESRRRILSRLHRESVDDGLARLLRVNWRSGQAESCANDLLVRIR